MNWLGNAARQIRRRTSTLRRISNGSDMRAVERQSDLDCEPAQGDAAIERRCCVQFPRCIKMRCRVSGVGGNYHNQAGQRRVTHHLLRRPVVLDRRSGWFSRPGLAALTAGPAFAARNLPTSTAAAIMSLRGLSTGGTTPVTGSFTRTAVSPRVLPLAARVTRRAGTRRRRQTLNRDRDRGEPDQRACGKVLGSPHVKQSVALHPTWSRMEEVPSQSSAIQDGNSRKTWKS